MARNWYEELRSEEDGLRVLFSYLCEKDSGLERKDVYNAFEYLFRSKRMAEDIAVLWERTEEDIL